MRVMRGHRTVRYAAVARGGRTVGRAAVVRERRTVVSVQHWHEGIAAWTVCSSSARGHPTVRCAAVMREGAELWAAHT